MSPTIAHAAPAPSPQLYFPNLLLAADSPAKGQSVQIINSGGGVALTDAVVSIDTTKLAGVASATVVTYDGRPNCTSAATSITCPLGAVTVNADEAGQVLVNLDFTPVTGARPEQKGEVTFTLSGRGRAPVVKTSTVTIAEGVNLTAGPNITEASKPGGQVTIPATVRNSGTTIVHETVLDTYLQFDAFAFSKRFSNCEYAGSRAVCHFNDDLAPGQEYSLSEPMPLSVRADTPAPRSFPSYLNWETAAEAGAWLDDFRAQQPKAGTAGELHLVATPPKMSARAQTQTDIDNSDNWSFATVNVTGDNHGDLAAVGTTVKGDIGTTVIAKVGAKNLGPARVGLSDGAAAQVRVVIPKGTTAVSVPEKDCWPWINGQAAPSGTPLTGAAEYMCATSTWKLDVNETYTWEFGLRIDSAGETAGTITLDTFDDELNKSNNAAQIIVNPAGGLGGGSGTLPITGADVGLAAGAGVALIAVGGFGYLAARRRRSRFVA
jgi:hypothetical protein